SVEENKRRDAKNTELKSKVGELEARFAIVEQGFLVALQNDKETIAEMLPEVVVSDVDLSNAVEKEMDTFLVEVNKKNISDKIKERRWKKKVQHKTTAKDSSPVTSDLTHCEEDLSIESVILPEQVVKESIPEGTPPVKSSIANKQTAPASGSYKDLSSCTKGNDDKISKTFDIQIPELSLETILMGSSEVTAQNITDLFRVAMKLRLRDIKSKNGVDDKSARMLVYSEIKPLFPDITDEIINDFPKKATNTDDVGYEDSVPIWNRHVTLKTNKTDALEVQVIEVSTLASVSSTSQSHDQSYFRNKTLGHYPNLYREFSSENFDYYGITNKTSCLLCKLDHNEESIEGRYKAGSYFIKCEQREIEISDKILTPEYLDWHAKLSGLPSILTNKIQSNLYKKYKQETGHKPWQLSKAVIVLAKPQAPDFKPITFEARPDPELIIKSVLEHFPYLKF
ncbi:12682_t:CDS:2, partial [Racocetra fulgida]